MSEVVSWSFIDYLLAIMGVAAVLSIVRRVLRSPKPHGSEPYRVPPPTPEAERRVFRLSELQAFGGRDASAPVYLAAAGYVFDVSSRRDMYGKPGQGYNAFCGRDASRALAKMDFVDKANLTDDLTGCGDGELETLREWVVKFKQQYDIVGYCPESKARVEPLPIDSAETKKGK